MMQFYIFSSSFTMCFGTLQPRLAQHETNLCNYIAWWPTNHLSSHFVGGTVQNTKCVRSHTGVMDYDEACFMHLTPGVVHNFPQDVNV